ncbi:MAG TPA: YkgJ family cysteine cluster protein [Deltaproteobacteria bacterium]|nr:YkgJ family cysteine cluster protein [Deltaproteobacteria bacterium]
MSQGPETYIDKSRQLKDEDTFCFSCTPDKGCFTDCCYDLSLILMPYDILRLKNHLGMKSADFLKRYTNIYVGQNSGLPIVSLNMEGPYLKCPFLEEGKGCTVYKDRPGACRTYPLARVACRSQEREGVEEFYYIVREPDCEGFQDGKEWTVRGWKENEGIEQYNEMNDIFGELLQAKTVAEIAYLNAGQIDIFHMGCYDIDGFRKHFLEGPNLDRYMESEEVIEAISNDEKSLLKYGMRWVNKKLFQRGCLASGSGCSR